MKDKKNITYGVVSICILVASLVFAILDAVVPSFVVWTHPVLNFLFGIFLGFGILVLCMAVEKKKTWFFFVSGILIGLAVFYVLMQYVFWWLSVIILVAVWAVFAITSVMSAGNMTESISINKSSDYKTYEQKKAEEKAKEAEEKAEKPLPEIKSFK